MEHEENTELRTTVEYIRRWVGRSNFHVLKHSSARNAYKSHNLKGIFHMFLHRSFFECNSKWTNTNLVKKFETLESSARMKEEHYAYVGFLIALPFQNLMV